MKFDVSTIVKSNGASLNIAFNDVMHNLNFDDGIFVFSKPLMFEGNITNASGVLKLDGKLQIEYASKCSRCLKDIDGKLNIAIKEEFINKEDATDDTETYTYSGNYVTLDKVFEDNITLNLPMTQLCTKKCKGLCPKCGLDLNIKPCTCEEDLINPRMAALKDFFKEN